MIKSLFLRFIVLCASFLGLQSTHAENFNLHALDLNPVSGYAIYRT